MENGQLLIKLVVSQNQKYRSDKPKFATKMVKMILTVKIILKKYNFAVIIDFTGMVKEVINVKKTLTVDVFKEFIEKSPLLKSAN